MRHRTTLGGLDVEVEFWLDWDQDGSFARIEGVFAVANRRRISDDLSSILRDDVLDTLIEQLSEDSNDRAPDGRDWMDVAKEDR